MNYIRENEIIDDILNAYRGELGRDYEQYRNHVYRVYNFALPNTVSEQDIGTLTIACAFHDLGIWTSRTFDYIAPSVDLAKKYCAAHKIGGDVIAEIEIMITEHHKLSKVKRSVLAETFRQADLTDLTLGIIHKGTWRKEIGPIQEIFPNRGFHLNLWRLFLKNLLVNPLRPLPMYKW